MFYYAELSSLLAQAKEQAELEQDRKEEENRRAHVRPWDRGKGTNMHILLCMYMYIVAWIKTKINNIHRHRNQGCSGG